MQVLNVPRLEEAWRKHPDAENALKRWLAVTRTAAWAKYIDIRKTFPATDPVRLESGAVVTVFDIKGNTYRLITTIDYRRQIVTVWHFLTHAEYDKEKWKATL